MTLLPEGETVRSQILKPFGGGARKPTLLEQQTPLATRDAIIAKQTGQDHKQAKRDADNAEKQRKAETALRDAEAKARVAAIKFDARQRRREAFRSSFLGRAAGLLQRMGQRMQERARQGQAPQGPLGNQDDRILTGAKGQVRTIPLRGDMPSETLPTVEQQEEEAARIREELESRLGGPR